MFIITALLMLFAPPVAGWGSSLPGGHSVGDELYYTGPMKYHSLASMPMFSQYTMQPPLMTGLLGKVEGAGEGVDMLKMKFPMLLDTVLDLPLKDLSKEKPPPPDIRWWFMVLAVVFVLLVAAVVALFFIDGGDDSAAEKKEQ